MSLSSSLMFPCPLLTICHHHQPRRGRAPAQLVNGAPVQGRSLAASTTQYVLREGHSIISQHLFFSSPLHLHPTSPHPNYYASNAKIILIWLLLLQLGEQLKQNKHRKTETHLTFQF